MKRRKYVLYGIFVICFTKVFYILLDGLVRGDKEYSEQSSVFFDKRNISISHLNRFATIDKRPESVKDVCKTLKANVTNSRTPSVQPIYHFYDRSRICSCHVPKAASTSIGRALLISEYPEKADIFRSLPGHNLHMRKEVQNVTSEMCFKNSATSFLVTRDPYRRLYFSYIDKVYLKKFHKFAVHLDVIYDKGVTKEQLKEVIINNEKLFREWYCAVTDVSFEHFLKYLTTSNNLDNHFAPVSLLCDPCSKHYDVILKQESLADDIEHLFEKNQRNQSAKVIPALTDYTGESGIESQIITYYTHWRSWLSKNNCAIDKEFYNAINRRLWNGLKLLGSIDENLEFIDELFRGPTGEKVKIKNPKAILYEFKKNKVPYLDSDGREKQRRKYLIQAYQNVDKSVIKKIQHLFQLDFTLFDYDPDPPT